MPVRLLNLSIMRWPNRTEVHGAIDQWVKDGAGTSPPNWLAIGYFGSYARGEAGVGSDLDLVMIVLESDLPFERRATVWDFHAIPVPVEVSVYTLAEWQRLPVNQSRFYQTLMAETVWLQPLQGSRESG